MSYFCMRSFDLRQQKHLVDERLCFDYDLRIPRHAIYKISYIRFDMKSSKMIVWLICDHPPLVLEERDSRNEIQ